MILFSNNNAKTIDNIIPKPINPSPRIARSAPDFG